MRIRIKNWLFFICILNAAFCINKASAQADISTPYSRFGIGDISSSGFAKNMGMGGIGIGMSSPFNVNFLNPASYASLALTTFEGGLNGNLTWLNASGVSSSSGSTSFGYFAFGFPIKAGKWGLSFGLLPYSNVNYNISDVEPDPQLGNISYTYQGTGGINQFYIGTGYSLFRNLRIGVNAAYLFGTVDQVRTVVLPDNVYYFNTRVTDKTTVGDFHLTYGMQFTMDSLKVSHSDSIMMIRRRIAVINKQIDLMKDSLTQYQKRLSVNASSVSLKGSVAVAEDSIASMNKQIDAQNELKKHVVKRRIRKDWSLNLGATLSLTSNIHASQSQLTELFINSAGFVVVKDTAENTGSQSGVIRLPLSAGFGFTVRKGTQWLFGADITSQDWSTFRTFGLSDSLVNSIQYAVGAQYTPNDRSIDSYRKIIQYRLGFHYTQTYLNLKSTQLNDYGVSIGFGIPMRKTLTIIHFAFEVGKMGTLVNQLVEVSYFKFTLGLSLSDVWFLKQRID